jgi:hypothetical protein
MADEPTTFVTRHRYATLLGRDSRAIRRPADAMLEVGPDKFIPLFELDSSAISNFRKLKEQLFGDKAETTAE